MRHLDFVTCLADPDVWMQPVKKADGSTCYDYILLYIDDTLVISERPDVGSPQVPFLMCTLEIPQKLQHKFFALNFCYLYF